MANYIHVPESAPVVPKLDVTVDEHDYRPAALQLIKALRPHWKPTEVKMKVTNLCTGPLTPSSRIFFTNHYMRNNE